jgi:hypothetical protein
MTNPPPTNDTGRSRSADEGGAVLVLALGLVIALGVLVGALAGLAAPSFVHSSVVRQINDTVATADSGIEYAIQSVKDDPDNCQNLFPTNSPVINGRKATVTCTKLPGTPTGISELRLQSTAHIGSSSAGTVQSRAVIQINSDTGSPTIMSWTTCDSGGC